jgi:hypothetical protein
LNFQRWLVGLGWFAAAGAESFFAICLLSAMSAQHMSPLEQFYLMPPALHIENLLINMAVCEAVD